MKKVLESLRAYLVLTIILGFLYPFLVFAVGRGLMPEKANGSLIKKDNKVIGSKLIGQGCLGREYFHSRPSAVNFDGNGSGGSNLGPSSAKLIVQAEENVKKNIKENYLKNDTAIPADMVLASASGLDPHISVANALLQIPRVAKTRKIPENSVKEKVYDNIDPDFIGIWGHRGVNVFKLNLALDEFKENKKVN